MRQGEVVPRESTLTAWRWVLAGILVLAVVARLTYSLGVCRGLLGIDPAREPTDGYHLIADNLYAGNGYRFREDEPLTLARPPAYPLFLLAMFSLVGVNYLWVQIAQALLGALGSWLLFRLGRWVFSIELGLAAAAMYALYPNAIMYSARLYAENLYFPLFLAFAYVICRASIEGSIRRGLLAGALWGATLLTRGSLIALPLLLPLGIALSRVHRSPSSRWIRWSLPALLAGILVITPWMVRNYSLTGAVVPVSSWGWVPLYQGTQVGKEMYRWDADLSYIDQAAARHVRDIAVERSGSDGPVIRTPRDEIEFDKLGRELTLAEWRADPVAFLGRSMSGLVFTWFFAFDAKMRWVSLALHLCIFALTLTGAIVMARRYPAAFQRAWPALGLILFTNVFYAVSWPHVRYMAPAISLGFIFAAVPLLIVARRLWGTRATPSDLATAGAGG